MTTTASPEPVAGPSVTASFALAGAFNEPGGGFSGQFIKLVEKPLTAGSWLAFSTVSAIGNGLQPTERATAIDCELRDNLGGVIGASSSSGQADEFTADTWTIAVNGGYAVAPGDSTKSLALWCRSRFFFLSTANTQLMVVKIGGID